MGRKAYSGNSKPFVYAMFASEDRKSAEETLNQLDEKGFALWPSERFDKWRIEKSALFLLFLSPDAAKNEAVNRAIQYAVQADHPMLTIYLGKTELNPTQRLLLNTQQGIMRYETAEQDEYLEKLFGSALLQNLEVTPAQKREARIITWGASLCILAAAALAILLALGGGATVPEDSLLSELGYSGKMAKIDSIYLYGDQLENKMSDSVFLGKRLQNETEAATDIVLYGDGVQAVYGAVEDISDFAQLKNLKELSLAGNRVANITPLLSLNQLEALDLSGNPVKDLTGIDALKRLNKLHITGTQITDLAPLLACENLKTVYVDEAQYARFQESVAGAQFSLVVSGPVEEMRNLGCHIFAGVEETEQPSEIFYGVFVMTGSTNTYKSYEYTVLKDGVALPIQSKDFIDIDGDGKAEKTHLMIRVSDMGRYNPESTYTLVVKCGTHSATYQIWHKYDKTAKNPFGGALISTEGFTD